MSEQVSTTAVSPDSPPLRFGAGTANTETSAADRGLAYRRSLEREEAGGSRTVRGGARLVPETGSAQVVPAAFHAARRPNRRGNVRRNVGLFRVEARYEGTVLSVNGGIITAHLQPSDLASEFVTAEIPVTDVEPHDRRHITPGAVFYWISGYEETPSWRRASILSFAGYKRMSGADVKERQAALMTLLEDDADGEE